MRAGLFLAILAISGPILKARQLPIKTYGTAEGLARNNVKKILRDSRGFLWFATSEGISRFDGYAFTNYGVEDGLPQRNVNDVIETRDGERWFATSGGFCRLRVSGAPGKSGSKFSVYRPSGPGAAEFTNVLLEDHTGAIWCGTRGGLFRLAPDKDPATLRFVDAGIPRAIWGDAVVRALWEDRLQRLWIGTEAGLYLRHSDGHMDQYTMQDGLPSDLVYAVLEDSVGRIWAGTEAGLCQLANNPGRGKPVIAAIYTARHGLPNNSVQCLLETSDHKLWVGTRGGLSEFTAPSGSGQPLIQSYTSANGLSDRDIQSLGEDYEGNLWAASNSGGAMKFVRNGFSTYTAADGLGDPHITSIFEDRHGILYATSGYLDALFINRFDGRRFVPLRPNLPKRITNFGWGWNQVAFADTRGYWWIPTGQGLFHFPPGGVGEQRSSVGPDALYTDRDGLTGGNIFRLFEDSRGDVWVVVSNKAKNGLSRWERATHSFRHFSEADGLPLAVRVPSAFAEDRHGNVWVGFARNGLARYHDGHFTLFTIENGLPAGWIQSLYFDRGGRLWIGSERGGLARVDDPSATALRFVLYTRAQGLSSNEVRCITEDAEGRIYAGTGRGVDRLDPATGNLRHYTTADGLAGGEVQVAFRDRQGVIWFGSTHGISRFIPETERPRTPVPVFISSIRLAGRPYAVSELGQKIVPLVELAAGENAIQIDFVGLSFAPGEALRYQYRLEGADRDWSAPAAERSVNYASLSPGKYRFLVRALNSDGIASPEPATVAFNILPPVWRRWWFQSAGILLLALASYGVHRLRITRVLELERVRTRIATDLHDDIGASLSYMSILSEVLDRQTDGERDAQRQALSEIGVTARELVDSMSDVVWAIDPENDRLRDLAQRMRWLGGEVFQARKIQFQFQGPVEGEDFEVRTDLRREIFLIFKEAVNNIVRHSGGTEARVEFRSEGEWLVLKVADNGRAFDPSRIHGGHGVRSMRERANRMGGILRIVTDPSAGTALTLRVPRSGTLAGWKRFLHRGTGTCPRISL